MLPYFADQTAQLLKQEVSESIFRCPDDLRKNIGCYTKSVILLKLTKTIQLTFVSCDNNRVSFYIHGINSLKCNIIILEVVSLKCAPYCEIKNFLFLISTYTQKPQKIKFWVLIPLFVHK